MLELRIGSQPDHSPAPSNSSGARSPQEILTQFLSSPESQELRPAERRELLSLARERDSELFHSGLLHMAGRVENSDRIALAGRFYSLVLGHSAEAPLRNQAQSRLAVLQGGGDWGDRVEFLSRHFVSQATDPSALAAMAVGGAAFRVARLGLLGRLMSSPAASWATRGFGARFLAGTGAFLAESTAFTLSGRGFNALSGRSQDWSLNALSREWAAGALTLASLRGFGAIGGGLYRRFHGPVASPWQTLYAQSSMFGGILVAHHLEGRLGLRDAVHGSNALLDGLVTLLHFNVAGRLSRDLMGSRWQNWERGLDQRAESWSHAFPRPSFPNSISGLRTLNPALVGSIGRPRPSSPLSPSILMMEGKANGEAETTGTRSNGAAETEARSNGAGASSLPPESTEQPQSSTIKSLSWLPSGEIRPEAVRDFLDALPDTAVLIEFANGQSEGTGLNGRILMANARIEEKFGYSQEEALNMSLGQFTNPENGAVMARLQQSVLTTGQIKFREVPFLHRNGTAIYCDVRGNAQRVGERVIGFAILQDVSQRRRTHELVQAERARFRALLKGVPDVMLRITREGEIVDAHYERPENFIVPLQAVIGMQVKNLPAPPHLVELAMNTIRQALETGEPQLAEYVLPMPDGSQRIQEGRMMRSGADEIVATIRDVTEARQAEGHRIAAARAESVKLIGRGLAHDAANALVPLMMTLEHSLKALEGAKSRGASISGSDLNMVIDDLKTASHSADRIRSMVAGFRELSIEPAFGPPFDLQALLNPSILRAMVGQNVEIRVRRSTEPWLVPGPRGNIERVIQNLVGNANDAMEGRPGFLRIESDRVVLSAEDLRRMSAPDILNRNDNTFARLRVQDNGPGIPPENLSRIFEPYFSTKRKEDGAGHGGLGLALTQKMVQDAGGFIKVESDPGMGATFDVYLPLVPAPVPSLEARRDLPAVHSKPVLVVSQDPALHQSVQNSLGRRGFSRILAASSYEQALQLANAEGGIGALLTDYRLPGNMFGLKLMQALRVQDPQLPAVVWTEQEPSYYSTMMGPYGKVMDPSTVGTELGFTLEELISQRLKHPK